MSYHEDKWFNERVLPRLIVAVIILVILALLHFAGMLTAPT